MSLTLDDTVLVPVADPDDGRETARRLAPMLGPDSTAILIYVIEKGGGTIDKTSPDHQKEYANEVFTESVPPLEDHNVSVETEIVFGTDVAETIFDTAMDRNASAIVFSPRGGSRIIELLTGDVAREVINNSPVPVVVMPTEESKP